MPTTRTYADPCGIARALDVIGDRWALLVVRELLHGPKRFTDLRAGLGKVSAEMLGQRLRDLERDGVVSRDDVYALTDRGRDLAPVLEALGRWGSVARFPDAHGPLTPDALAVALETLYAGGVPAPVRIDIAGDVFTFIDGIAIRDDRVTAVALVGDTATFASVLWHDGDPGELEITGNRRLARHFLRAFPLPTEPVF